jgi:ketosteroid isomerase-like protein
MAQEDVEAIRAMFREVAAGDTMAFLRMMDPEVRVRPRPEEPGVRDVYVGWEGAVEYVANWFGQWEEYEAVPVEFTDAGDDVLIVFHERGRMERDGVQVEQDFSHSFRLVDGRIAEWRMYDTHAQALEALGLSG